jgi:hypothetical protein
MTTSTLNQPATMTGWTSKGTAITESFADRQGSHILLDETYRSWTLVVTQKSGEGNLGIWGKDGSGRDAMIYNGACAQGQHIPVGMEYRNVHVAVNLAIDDPPVENRWNILGTWYRQSHKPARIELELWVYKQP